jgi:hypothetical protein
LLEVAALHYQYHDSLPFSISPNVFQEATFFFDSNVCLVSHLILLKEPFLADGMHVVVYFFVFEIGT